MNEDVLTSDRISMLQLRERDSDSGSSSRARILLNPWQRSSPSKNPHSLKSSDLLISMSSKRKNPSEPPMLRILRNTPIEPKSFSSVAFSKRPLCASDESVIPRIWLLQRRIFTFKRDVVHAEKERRRHSWLSTRRLLIYFSLLGRNRMQRDVWKKWDGCPRQLVHSPSSLNYKHSC